MATIAASKPRGLFRRPTAETGIWSWVTTVDHKRIGILYLLSGGLFFLVGGFEAFMIRMQLWQPDNPLVSAQTFNQLFTMHATTMIFLAIMPLFAGFTNFFLPIMIGARDVAFPRLNAFSFWSFLAAGIFINSSWLLGHLIDPAHVHSILGGAPNGGWFAYAPLTTNYEVTKMGLSAGYAPGPGMDFYALGVQLAGLGTLVSSFNFLVTILNMRAPGMSLMRLPLFVWTALITNVLVAFSFPSLTVNLFLLTFDRFFGANFFNVQAGANVFLWQHLFWIFGHPEVYILILPGMGIVSEILPVFSEKPLFGYTAMVWSIITIGFLSFMVWSHHMFADGQGPVVNSIFSLTTMAISVPTGVKIFNWISTLWGGRLRFKTAMMYAVSFIAMFTIGGLSGLMHASAPSDYQQHDTYFIVAHIHYVLIGGALFAIFAAMYYWWPKMFGRELNEKLGQTNFWFVLVGFNVTFFPFHFLGLMGMPRRIYTYGAELGFQFWNQVSTVGVVILALGVVLFWVNVFYSAKNGVKAVADPWDGRTLEWTTASPPPIYNFAVVPTVRGRDALWVEKKQPLPTSSKTSVPAGGHHSIHMPGQSWMPAIISLGLFILVYGGVFHSLPVAAVGLLVAVLGIYGWVFEGDGAYYIEPEGDK